MPLVIHNDSHLDHVPLHFITYALGYFKDENEALAETIILPIGEADCALYGPWMGDDPITEAEVIYQTRGNRSNLSRLVNRPMRRTKQLTVIAGPHEGSPCVLYTAYGGPLTPREPTDPHITSDEERVTSQAFWSQHALSRFA